MFIKKNSLIRSGVFYSPDPEGSGGSGNPPAGDPPAGNPPAGDPPKTFTQEQVDNIIKDRLTRAEESATTKLLEAIGVKTVDELKTSLKDFKKIQEDKLSEQQKMDRDLKEAQTKAETAEAEKTKALAEAFDTLVRAEVKLSATKLGFRDESLDDVFVAIKGDKALMSKIELKEGKLSGIEEAVKAISTLRPFWLDDKKKPFGTPPPKGKPNTPPQPRNGEEKRERPLTL